VHRSTQLETDKAIDPNKEVYSGFDGTTLGEMLWRDGVRRVFVGGLATDYCVKRTVLNALKRGFETVLLEDTIRGVDVRPGDSERAVKDMRAHGAQIATYPNMVGG
jgi:nicotinamidase-related amidase